MMELRGRRGRSWTLLTPSNRYASHLPGLRGAVIFKLITPRFAGARFAEYLVELDAGGGSDMPFLGHEHFLYVLDGDVDVLDGERVLSLQPGGFAYLPADASLGFRAAKHGTARFLWLKRRYEPWPGVPAPSLASGDRDDALLEALPIPGLSRRELIAPDDAAFDFNMSLLCFAPGAALDRVEIHDEEHGLYMTRGAGRYYLDGEHHDVREGDFIYMAPYCPQSFQATGAEPAEYLLYKDVFRDGF